jgi:hypothetical protein
MTIGINWANGVWLDASWQPGVWLDVADTTPDAFSFTDQTGVALGSEVISAAITVSGINSPAAITVTGGSYSINGGAFTSSPGTVSNGNTVQAKHTSASAALTATNTVVTIGGISDTFTSTTGAVSATASGGWFMDFEADYRRRKRRQEELEAIEREQESIEDQASREIARLLQDQERKDERRKDLERIKALVKQYPHVDSSEVSSERVQRALKAAQEKQTRANLERLEREFQRMVDEEDEFLTVLLMLANE